MTDEVTGDEDLEDPDGIDAYEAMMREMPPTSPEEQAAINALMSRARTPLSRDDPRRHHYIPQFFQNRFAGPDEHLMVLRLADRSCKSLHTGDIAVWRDLYTHIDQDVGETVAVEKLLAEIDGLGAKALNVIDWGLVPQTAERAALATWVAFLAVRDPFTRRTMEALADQTYKLDLLPARSRDTARARLRQNLGREPSAVEVEGLVHMANNLSEFEVQPHQNEFIRMMLDTGKAMYPHVLRRRITVIRYEQPGLVLSDRPLVLYMEPENRDSMRGIGVANADELWLPIDRRTVVMFHNRPQVPERMVMAPSWLSMESVNQWVVGQARAEIYFHQEDAAQLTGLEFPEGDKPLYLMEADPRLNTGTDGINEPPKRKRARRYKAR